MDALLSDEERNGFAAAADFARAELDDPELAARERAGAFWTEGYRRCGRFGLTALPMPREYGGRGASIPVTVASLEGAGFGCADTGLIFALGASLWTVTLPILEFGTEAQKRRWLPGLCDGSIVGANAASEPEAGSDIFSLQTSARRDGDGWLLNGRKVWITAAPVAGLFLIFATTDPARGPLGITAFLVPRDTPGLRVAREIPKMGLRTAPMGEVVLEHCVLPADALLGREGRGARIFQRALEWERGAILAPVVGAMRRQLERCCEHARRRRQFGQPIGRFQAVAHRLAEMALRLQTCRPLVYAFARARAAGRDATLEASLAKWHISECFVQNSLDAVRTFGASGYAVESGVERDLRDGVGGVIFSGTNDIQKNIIAQSLRI
jgi:alkylation response protein AidB-like acyl-CoA dehydrogenase